VERLIEVAANQVRNVAEELERGRVNITDFALPLRSSADGPQHFCRREHSLTSADRSSNEGVVIITPFCEVKADRHSINIYDTLINTLMPGVRLAFI